ncbi:MAG: hypothetical protein ACLU4J_16650 [Butyricimonas paravirosa]
MYRSTTNQRNIGIRELKVQPYTEYYEFWYEQPIDHNNPSKELSNKGYYWDIGISTLPW